MVDIFSPLWIDESSCPSIQVFLWLVNLGGTLVWLIPKDLDILFTQKSRPSYSIIIECQNHFVSVMQEAISIYAIRCRHILACTELPFQKKIMKQNWKIIFASFIINQNLILHIIHYKKYKKFMNSKPSVQRVKNQPKFQFMYLKKIAHRPTFIKWLWSSVKELVFDRKTFTAAPLCAALKMFILHDEGS